MLVILIIHFGLAPISKGITILRYSSPDDSRISVEPNEEVLIYVKEYGPKKDLWGVVVSFTKLFLLSFDFYGVKILSIYLNIN